VSSYLGILTTTPSTHGSRIKLPLRIGLGHALFFTEEIGRRTAKSDRLPFIACTRLSTRTRLQNPLDIDEMELMTYKFASSFSRGARRLVTLAAALLPNMLAAQATGILTGVVRDEAGNPVQGATITLGGTQIGARGPIRWQISPCGGAGRYAVSARLIGYASRIDTVNVHFGRHDDTRLVLAESGDGARGRNHPRHARRAPYRARRAGSDRCAARNRNTLHGTNGNRRQMLQRSLRRSTSRAQRSATPPTTCDRYAAADVARPGARADRTVSGGISAPS
jgi:hypothetical protein